jgi:hypothetical protein
VEDFQKPRTYDHISDHPVQGTLFLQSRVPSEGLEVLMPYFAHVLSLFSSGSCVVDSVCLLVEHDGPDGVVTKAESCTTEDDDGYGRAVPDSPSTCSDQAPRCYTLEGSIGLAAGRPAVPLTFDLADCATHKSPLARAWYKVWKSDDSVILQAKSGSLPGVFDLAVPSRAASDRVQTVCVNLLPDTSRRPTMAFLSISTSQSYVTLR